MQLKVGKKLTVAKFAWWIQNHCSGKPRQALKLLENFLCILLFSVSFFWSLHEVKIESSEPWNIGSSLYNDKSGQRIENHFSGKVRLALKFCHDFLPMLEFPINLFWSLSNAKIKSSVRLNVSERLKNAKFARRIQNYFSGKLRQTLKPLENFIRILQFSINFFWSLYEAKIESSDPWNIGSSLYNDKFGQRIENHFSRKARLALKLYKDFLSMLEFPIKVFLSLSKI